MATLFIQTFGREPDIVAAAPGRVNVIGEHTDYHQGFVLPMPLAQRTTVSVGRRNDHRVRAVSAAMQPEIDEYQLGEEARGAGWIDYLQGVTAALAQQGCPLTGLNVSIESALPPGGGVSSSAALTVALLRGLTTMFDRPLTPTATARLAHRVETGFIGVPVGFMDQMVCSVGRPNEALFLDTRTLAFERLPWPAAIEPLVINSGITHAHVGGQYASRRRESFAAASLLGVRWLRDATLEMLGRKAMPDRLARRARHVISENQRVLDAVDALKAGDVRDLGTLLNESHASMRDDYETTTAEIDELVALGQADPDVYGARLTGGGFGGCVLLLADAGRSRAVADRILPAYRHRTGVKGSLLPPALADQSTQVVHQGGSL